MPILVLDLSNHPKLVSLKQNLQMNDFCLGGLLVLFIYVLIFKMPFSLIGATPIFEMTNYFM